MVYVPAGSGLPSALTAFGIRTDITVPAGGVATSAFPVTGCCVGVFAGTTPPCAATNDWAMTAAATSAPANPTKLFRAIGASSNILITDITQLYNRARAVTTPERP